MDKGYLNTRSKRGIVLTIPLFLLLFSGCGVVLNGRYYDVREPGEAVNPTSYDFDFSRSEVMTALDSCFTYKDYGRGKGARQQIKGLRISYSHGKIQLGTSRGPDDFYRSYVYRKKKTNEKLSLSYDFLLEVDSLTPRKTRVNLISKSHSVYAGDYFLFNPRSMDFRIPRFLQLGSTTIEEYEVLLILGKILGQKGMPPVRYPRAIKFEDVRKNFLVGDKPTLPFTEEDMLFGE